MNTETQPSAPTILQTTRTKAKIKEEASELDDVLPELKPVPTIEPNLDGHETSHVPYQCEHLSTAHQDIQRNILQQVSSMERGDMSGVMYNDTLDELVPGRVHAGGHFVKTNVPKNTGLIQELKY